MESPAMTDADNSIRAVGLGKRFGDKVVLEGVDFTIEPGTVFGYVGPNGAGKSTTVKILVGMIQDFEGAATIAGIDVATRPLDVKRVIGYVPENAQLYEALTPAEYLEFVARLHDLDEPTLDRRALALLEALDLGPRAHARISTLSKGMRQKVLLASALIHDPRVLVLDEPLSGLDVRSMIVVKELIRGFADSGRTVLYCSHVMDVVERVCDRIAILDHGRIVAAGSFEELAAQSQQSSLEQVFRKLTGGGDEAEQARRILAAIDR